ncbi:MAG: hypothetical protein ACMXYL_03830 [Candidatus Woesearchaeota archaeon]
MELKSSKIAIVLSVFLLLILLPIQSQGIGVRSCGPYYHDYEPYKTIDLYYDVVSRGPFEMSIEGPFADNYDIQTHGNIVTGNIVLPPGFDTPGTHLNAITFTELAEGTGMAVAVAAIRCPVFISYPYPGKYLIFDASIENINLNEKAEATITIESKGDEPVRNAILRIEIGKDTTTDVVHTESFNTIMPSEKLTKTIMLSTELLSPGLYQMRAYLSYEQESLNVTRGLRVGSLDINILDITDEINQSPFTRIRFHLENNWNNPVRHIYVVYTINDAENNYGPQRSPGIDLAPFESQWVESIIETPGISPGMHFINYEVYFEDNRKEGTSQLRVHEVTSESNITILLIAIGSIMTMIIIVSLLIIKTLAKRKDNAQGKKPKSKRYAK